MWGRRPHACRGGGALGYRRAATRTEGAAAPPGDDEEADVGVAVVKMDEVGARRVEAKGKEAPRRPPTQRRRGRKPLPRAARGAGLSATPSRGSWRRRLLVTRPQTCRGEDAGSRACGARDTGPSPCRAGEASAGPLCHRARSWGAGVVPHHKAKRATGVVSIHRAVGLVRARAPPRRRSMRRAQNVPW
jgi:hypothetical protein